MTLAAWKAKIQALFRPRPHDAQRIGTEAGTAATSVSPNALEDEPESALAERGAPAYDDRERFVTALTQWSGQDIYDLPIDVLPYHPEWDQHPALEATVPLQERDEVWGQRDPLVPHFDASVTLLALDARGGALVRRHWVHDITGAEGWSYRVMPSERAYALLADYRRTPNQDGDAQRAPQWADPTAIDVHLPEQRRGYRGPLVMIEGDTAYQWIRARTLIAHPLDALAVRDIQLFLGKTVDIDYPCRKVGLVRAVEAQAAPTHLDLPDKSHQGPAFER